MYETLCANLSLPSISTVARSIHSHSKEFFEGMCRAQDLRQFLQVRNLPFSVWLSEDATRITGRIQYDSNSNDIVGFVLPFNSQGMPIPFSFPATSAYLIEKYFKNGTTASSLYTIMAQPLQEDAPCFCLCLFGNDNKFTAEQVPNRWDFTIAELKKEGIRVVGISSDGDSRLLKAMEIKSNLGISTPNFEMISKNSIIPEFHASVSPPFICTKDTVHIAAKLKTQFLKPSITLPMGNFVASPGHIQILISTISRDKHQTKIK